MKGYIGVTDPNWFLFQKNSSHKEVIFWRRSRVPVKLDPGDYFFFLIKGRLPRYIQGFGRVKEVGTRTVEEMWNLYKDKNGSETLEKLEHRLRKGRSQIVAYYFLGKVTYLNRQNFVSDREVGFSKDIMAGKFIDQQNLFNLLSKIKNAKDLKTLPSELTSTPNTLIKSSSTYDELLEANIENILSERIEDIEDGLILVGRQYSVPPVGRIDLLCKDKDNNYVVIELKKYSGNTRSVIDQVTSYMGYVKKHLCKKTQKVRGIIIVGRKDEKLKFSSSIIPNLEVKTFKFNIE